MIESIEVASSVIAFTHRREAAHGTDPTAFRVRAWMATAGCPHIVLRQG